MKNSIKKFFLEAESDRDDNYRPFAPDVIDRVTNVDFSKKDDYLKIDFRTTYKKDMSLVTKFSDFQKWMEDYILTRGDKSDMFKQFVKDYAKTSKEFQPEEVNEIIDQDNQIIPDDTIPPNTTNSFVGLNHTMDLEKIFRRSMPKSVRNYSGNLGLGTVVW